MAGVAIAIVGVAACVWDFRTQRIPNTLTFGTALAGMVFHLTTSGWAGAGVSAAGWLAATALFFPLFAMRGMGAGDVKLLAAFGAWLGPQAILGAALAAALVGAALAVLVVARTRHTSGALYYSLPITAGALITLWLG